jgi:hypothetical protein
MCNRLRLFAVLQREALSFQMMRLALDMPYFAPAAVCGPNLEVGGFQKNAKVNEDGTSGITDTLADVIAGPSH